MVKITDEKRMALDWIEKNEQEIMGLSDRIWGYAEPALREFKSAKLHCDFLEKYGFHAEKGVGGMPTAFVAQYGSGKPVIGFYAEYDATPGESQKPVPYKAPVVPHGPGFGDAHNMLGAASSGAAVAVKEVLQKHNLQGTLKLFGTPAEKLCVGKAYLAREGYFDGLDAVLGWHPLNLNTVTWENGPGPYRFIVSKFHGVPVYSARPWAGKSALDAAILMINNINYMKEHVLPRDEYLSLNETISVGGQCLTSIPEYAEILLGVRARTRKGIDVVSEMLSNCAKAASLVTSCEHEHYIASGTRTMLPNLTMARLVYRNLQIVGPPKFTEEEKEFCRQIQKNIGTDPMQEPLDETLTPPEKTAALDVCGVADDYNEFTWYAPSAWLHIALIFNISSGHLTIPSWARSALRKMGVTHKGGIVAAETLAISAIELLTSPSELEKAKEEFKKRTKAGKEELAVPRDTKQPIELALPEFSGGEIIIRYPTSGESSIYERHRDV
jgi:aminobenzoyl-glutamate utilization protein B